MERLFPEVRMVCPLDYHVPSVSLLTMVMKETVVQLDVLLESREGGILFPVRVIRAVGQFSFPSDYILFSEWVLLPDDARHWSTSSFFFLLLQPFLCLFLFQILPRFLLFLLLLEPQRLFLCLLFLPRIPLVLPSPLMLIIPLLPPPPPSFSPHPPLPLPVILLLFILLLLSSPLSTSASLCFHSTYPCHLPITSHPSLSSSPFLLLLILLFILPHPSSPPSFPSTYSSHPPPFSSPHLPPPNPSFFPPHPPPSPPSSPCPPLPSLPSFFPLTRSLNWTACASLCSWWWAARPAFTWSARAQFCQATRLTWHSSRSKSSSAPTTSPRPLNSSSPRFHWTSLLADNCPRRRETSVVSNLQGIYIIIYRYNFCWARARPVSPQSKIFPPYPSVFEPGCP